MDCTGKGPAWSSFNIAMSVPLQIQSIAKLLGQEAPLAGPCIRETHASWVFLTARHAWKLKKIKLGSTAEAQRQRLLCENELALNQAFAPDVYLAVVPVYQSASGNLQWQASGEARHWLIKMRRLPDERSLEALIKSGKLRPPDARRVGRSLAQFHRRCATAPVSAALLRSRLQAALAQDVRQLRALRYRLPRAAVAILAAQLRQQARRLTPLLLDRVAHCRIVDAHGDLRAEHVYLLDTVRIIDRLDLSQVLRVQDGADDAGFLALECERLHAAWVADLLLQDYARARHDRIAPRLLDFYQACRACTRARLAVAHLDEPRYRHQARWRRRALDYLFLALVHMQRSAGVECRQFLLNPRELLQVSGGGQRRLPRLRQTKAAWRHAPRLAS